MRAATCHSGLGGRALWCSRPRRCDHRSERRLHSEQLRYTLGAVIKGFAHKGLEAFFCSGSKAGIQPAHAARLRRQLAQLDRSTEPRDMSIPGWNLYPLKGDRAGHWSVWVSGNWRLTFRFDGSNAVIVNYQDYH